MHSQFQSKFLRRRQNFARLRDIEITALAKDIAELRQLLLRDAWQHFINHKIDIFIRRRVARDGVSAEKRWDNFERELLTELPHHSQYLQLIVERESVTRLRF